MDAGFPIVFAVGLLVGYFTYDLIYRFEQFEGAYFKWPVTLATGFLYTALYLKLGLTLSLALDMLMVSTLLLIFVIDLKTQTIPNELNGILALLATLSILLTPSAPHLVSALFGAFAGSGFLLFIAIVSRGAIGGGDIKMMFGLGLFFGGPGTVAVTMLSFIAAALVSVVLLMTKIKGMKDFIPFGPFIVAASLAQLFFEKFLLATIGF